MARILRFYVLREVLTPTLLALLTIIAMLVIAFIYKNLDVVLESGASFSQIMGILGSLMPSLLVFAAPMAVLMGVMIGVGRLTLDREILAIRASGANLFSVFAPTLVLALVMSVLILWLSDRTVPRLLLSSMKRVVQLQTAVIDSLQPGRFYDSEKDIAGGLKGGQWGGSIILFFNERDPKTGDMMGITIKQEQEEGKYNKDAKKAESATKEKVSPKQHAAALVTDAAAQEPAAPPRADEPWPEEEESKTAEAEAVTTATAAQNDQTTSGGQQASGLLTKELNDKSVLKRLEDGKDNIARYRDSELTIIFARLGRLQALPDSDGDGGRNNNVLLHLEDGTIHRLLPDSAKRDYTVIRFEQLDKQFSLSTAIKKRDHTRSFAELREIIHSTKGSDRRGTARRELIGRYTMAPAFFVFALVGIPLAIWVRPSGKSWGILLAIGLMLVYFVLKEIGTTMVEKESSMGLLVAFAPNILYTILGAGLWIHTLRS